MTQRIDGLKLRQVPLALALVAALLSGCSRHPATEMSGSGTSEPGPDPTPDPAPGSFARGQWTRFSNDNKSFGSALFVGDGSAPYDVLADGTTSVKGQTVQQAEAGGGGPNGLLAGYSAGGIYVPSINQFVALLSTGHFGGGSNEVNVFDLSSGTWNPGGRPVNPTVRLFMKVGVTWPVSIAYGGYHLTVPVALVDTGNNYSANISASQLGIQAAPVNRQIYGGIADMPGTHKIFLFGGFGYWDASNGAASIGCTYDYATKKYQMLDAEQWPVGVQDNVTTAVWDSTYGRVLFATERSLYAYYPGRPQGQRLQVIVEGDGCGSDNCSTRTAVWDPKRKRLMLFGGAPSLYYDFSGGEFSPPPATAVSISGSGLIATRGPSVMYDPVADTYIHHSLGRTLVSINPTTFVGSSISPSAGDTPTTSNTAGEWEYYRLFYWAAKDAYVALPSGDTVGVYVYPPIR